MSASVVVSRPAGRSSFRRATAPAPEAKILFQQFFKSVGPRTYAAQVKEAGNGNHFVILTESKRKEGEDEPRKTRLFVFSEDFVEFFKLVKATAEFVKANPLSDEVKARQQKYWERKRDGAGRPQMRGRSTDGDNSRGARGAPRNDAPKTPAAPRPANRAIGRSKGLGRPQFD